MADTCFICGRVARAYDRYTNEPLCGLHRFQPTRPSHIARHVAILTHFHGPERAERILASLDEASNADLAAWRGLGR